MYAYARVDLVNIYWMQNTVWQEVPGEIKKKKLISAHMIVTV